MIYMILHEMECVVELGWYGEHKRHHIEGDGMENNEEEMKIRQKVNNWQEGRNKEIINLGSLCEAQYEEFKKRRDEIMFAQREQSKEVEARKKVEADLEMVIKRLQDMEEEKARQMTLKEKGEMKMVELEKERKH